MRGQWLFYSSVHCSATSHNPAISVPRRSGAPHCSILKPCEFRSVAKISKLIPSAFRFTYSSTFSLVRLFTVPTKTLGLGSTNQRLSIPRTAGGVLLAIRTVISLYFSPSFQCRRGDFLPLSDLVQGFERGEAKSLGIPLKQSLFFNLLFLAIYGPSHHLLANLSRLL